MWDESLYSGLQSRPESSGSFVTGVQKNKDGVPIWNGESTVFEEYAEACLRYEQTVVREKRYLCGPRIASELRGPAKRVLTGRPPEWLSFEGGVRVLLSALREERGQPKVPELSALLMAYFKGTKRQKGESMSDYITRKAEAYTRAQQSMARYQQQEGRTTSTPPTSRSSLHGMLGARRPMSPTGSMRSGPGGRTASRLGEASASDVLRQQGSLGEPTMMDGPDDGQEEGGDEDQWSSQDWQNWWQGWSGNHAWQPTDWMCAWNTRGPTDTTELGRESLPEILPDFVQGWLLFIDSGLDTLERNVLHAELKGEFGVRAVELALRKHWTDGDLRRRDQEKGRHMAHVAEEDEALLGEFDMEALEAEGYSHEELEIMSAEQEKMEEGFALIQEGRRTLKEARQRQHAVKMSRQFYPVPASGSGGALLPRRDPFKPRPGDGKGGIKCLRCGGPHKVAVCPERNKGEVPQPKAQAHVAEEAATFTFYVAEDEALGAVEQDSYLTTSDVVEQGKAVIDCGATRTVGSIYALEKIMVENVRKHGRTSLQDIDFNEKPVFNFGNSSRNRCASTAQMGVPMNGQIGSLRVHALDAGTSPVLLSVQSLKHLGATIDFEAGLAVFRKVAPDRIIRLEQTEAGHFVMPLTSDVFERAVKVPQQIPSLRDLI